MRAERFLRWLSRWGSQRMSQWRSGAAAPSLGVALLSILLTSVLYWPLPLHLSSWHTLSAFGDSQGWVFQEIYRRLTGQSPFTFTTFRSGYPYLLDARFLAWVPALVSLPFQPLLGPLGAYNVVLLVTPTLSTLAAYAFLRRITAAPPWLCAASSLLYAFSPFALTSLANGQIEKAQLWAYPLHLLLLHRAISSEKPLRSIALVALVTVAMTFTCPYFGLFLPLVAVPLAVGWAWRAPARARGFVLAFVALLVTAASMLPAHTYYGSSAQNSMFRFAQEPTREETPVVLFARAAASPVAQPRDTFLGTGFRDPFPYRCNHTTYLVLPVLLLAMALMLRRFPGRGSGLVLLGIGTIIAFGPHLVVENVYMRIAGHPYYLPAKLLDLAGYPLKQGGQYYRAIALSALGLAMLVCGGAARMKPSRGLVAVSLVVTIGLLDSLRATGPTWPRPAQPLPGLETFTKLAESPADGAVLALPFMSSETLGGRHLLEAAFHHRPTSAVARSVRPGQVSQSAPWTSEWMRIVSSDEPEQARAMLHELGFRYVILTPWPAAEMREDPLVNTDRMRNQLKARGMSIPLEPPPLDDRMLRLSATELTRMLGAPRAESGLEIWDLGSAGLHETVMGPMSFTGPGPQGPGPQGPGGPQGAGPQGAGGPQDAGPQGAGGPQDAVTPH